MAPQRERAPEQRRFLVINFWVGTRENGYLVGPTLVSTRDYERFHYWDESGYALLGEEDYEVVKVYPLGLTYDEVAQQFARDFPPDAGRSRAAGWIATDGAFYSLERWAGRGARLQEHCVIAA
jgi:hypothetical protein